MNLSGRQTKKAGRGGTAREPLVGNLPAFLSLGPAKGTRRAQLKSPIPGTGYPMNGAAIAAHRIPLSVTLTCCAG